MGLSFVLIFMVLVYGLFGIFASVALLINIMLIFAVLSTLQAMSSIIDAQVTTLIAALLLFSFGTGPIKGFAVTLWIGIMTSMFSAIWLTRLMVVTWLKQRKPKVLPI
jgi:preprotein translocase subunit SecD